DGNGDPLVAWETVAADYDRLPAGTRVVVTECGHYQSYYWPQAVCDQFRDTTWNVSAPFSTWIPSGRQLSFYIGEEDMVDFTSNSDVYLAWEDTEIRFLAP